MVFIVSFAIGYVAKWIILGGVRRLSRHWDNDQRADTYAKRALSMLSVAAGTIVTAGAMDVAVPADIIVLV